MKNSIFLVFLGVLMSCKLGYQPRHIETISIQEFKMDSTSVRAIHVVDKNTLYFVGANAKYGFTKDAGKSWKTRTIHYQDSIKPEFRSIASNGKSIFVLSIENPALLYKIDGDTVDLVYTENNPKVFYDAMAFFDSENGIAMGDPTDNCLSVIKTTDGGNTWIKMDCANLPKTFEGEAAFAASNTNIKIIDDSVWIVSGGSKSRVFKSEDRGETWQVFNTPMIQGKPSQGIYSIDFYDRNNGIIMGGDYSKAALNKANKAITTDGGKTWKIVAEGQDPNYRSCVQYVPNTKGQEVFTVGKMGISFSNDAGNSWRKISDEDYYTIQFVAKNTAWLGGHGKVGVMKF